jgi:hypothetical protein
MTGEGTVVIIPFDVAFGYNFVKFHDCRDSLLLLM